MPQNKLTASEHFAAGGCTGEAGECEVEFADAVSLFLRFLRISTFALR